MTNQTNPATNPHGDFERRDIGVAGVVYFLLGLLVFGVIICFLMTGLYDNLDKRTEAQQAPVSPLVTNAPTDTRHLPVYYKDYLKQNSPSPQLELDERTELNDERLREEQTLSTYDYVDQKAGTVRIPIDRAMQLTVQRGLPVRGQAAVPEAAAPQKAGSNKKGKQ
jgi:hypothetical protein